MNNFCGVMSLIQKYELISMEFTGDLIKVLKILETAYIVIQRKFS